MKRLYFIRSRTSFESDNYYETKTEVCVFGDVAGYAYLVKTLNAAGRATRPLVLTEIPHQAESMRVVILPAAVKPLHKPRLKAIERVVFLGPDPTMELLLNGNAVGYRKLANLIEVFSASHSGDPHDHFHIDDWTDAWFVKRSVTLNIRAPLLRWSRRALGDYESTVYTRSRHFLPEDIEYLRTSPWPYHIPKASDDPRLRLT